jgi:hypothetical protein
MTALAGLLIPPGAALASDAPPPTDPCQDTPSLPICGEPKEEPVATGEAQKSESRSVVFHLIQFPFQTMTEAVIKMTNSILGKTYNQAAGKVFGQAMQTVIAGPYGIAPGLGEGGATPLFNDFVRPQWQVTMTMAMLLLPGTLALTAVSAMRAGASSVLGYTDLKESLIGWVIAAGAAGASYYLLGLAHRLSLAAAGAILAASVGPAVNGTTLAGAFFNVSAFAAISWVSPSFALYVGLFSLFLASSVMIGLGMAIAAYTALAYLLAVIAPLVIVLGVLPPLRWLHALWLKAITLTFLLPLIDALLLRAAVSLFFNTLNAAGTLHPGTYIAGIFVTAGTVSVLITLNYKVGELAFGALGEIGRRSMESLEGIRGMVLGTVGAVAGFGLAGAAGAALGSRLGGVTASPSRAAASPADSQAMNSSDGPAANSSGTGRAPGVDPASSGSGQTLTPDPELERRTAQIASSAGRALALGTRNPLLRGFGIGAMIGGQIAEGQASAGLRRLATGYEAGRDGEAAQAGDYDRILAPSYRNPEQFPYPEALSRPHYDSRGLLARHLENRVPESPRAEARRLNDLMHDALRTSPAAGNPGALVAARQGLYDVYDPGPRSAENFKTRLDNWAHDNGLVLPSGWQEQVDRLYPPIPSS